MKILFCVEFYYPSMGGAQEVVRQLAERMAASGHEVTVVTSRVTTRTFSALKGVSIREFLISGNHVRGLQGDVEAYQKYLVESDFDVVLFYAAQQWTFDAAWQIMGLIRGKKVLVPCGYSGLYEPTYKEYFAELPNILRQIDRIVYHANNYRDHKYGILHSINHCDVIPNGADDQEFLTTRDQKFRNRLGVKNDALLFLTVGTLTGLKGHMELAKAFDLASFSGQKAALILNGNTPAVNGVAANMFTLFQSLLGEYGWKYATRHFLKTVLWSLGCKVGKAASLPELVKNINAKDAANKQVILCDLPRSELIQAYLNADLFVFASNVEYSPLVLFEACAAGLPFLSGPVGNAAEIVAWTGGGEVCPADVDERGYTRISPEKLARRMEALASDKERRLELGRSGRLAWEKRYNWKLLALEYEALFVKLLEVDKVPQNGEVPPHDINVGSEKTIGVHLE